MNREIEINKFDERITFANRGIGFSQIGVAKEILDLIDDLQQENKQLKSILTELEEYYKEQLEFIIELPSYTKDIAQEHKVMELCYEDFLNKIQELKEKYK